MAMKDLVKNNQLFVKMFSQAIKRECSAKETIKMNNKWKKDYEKQGYKLMSRENIFKNVVKILNNHIKIGV
jgi:threonine aldolase